MSQNDFDRLLKDKFDQHEFSYNHAGWEQLARKLPNRQPKRAIPFLWMKLTGVAAALAITISGVAWYYQTRQPEPGNTLAQQLPAAQTTNGNIPPTTDITTLNNSPEPIFPIPDKRKITDKKQTSNSILAARNQTVTITTAENEITATSPAVPSATTEPQPEVKIIVKNKHAPSDLDNAIGNKLPQLPLTEQPGKTFFSLTGGMNYGQLNTGYMAGVNLKQKISSKLFVEGDLAVVNNTTTQTFTPQQQQYAIANRAAIDYKNANLVYVGFNPTIGYQALKQLSVGVGADVQRRMNGEDLLVQVNDEMERTLPGTDIGLTGKTEVSLSKRLKAGVLYREGINNLLSGNSRYFDRRYVQVQLKFTVITK